MSALTTTPPTDSRSSATKRRSVLTLISLMMQERSRQRRYVRATSTTDGWLGKRGTETVPAVENERVETGEHAGDLQREDLSGESLQTLRHGGPRVDVAQLSDLAVAQDDGEGAVDVSHLHEDVKDETLERRRRLRLFLRERGGHVRVHEGDQQRQCVDDQQRGEAATMSQTEQLQPEERRRQRHRADQRDEVSAVAEENALIGQRELAVARARLQHRLQRLQRRRMHLRVGGR